MILALEPKSFNIRGEGITQQRCVDASPPGEEVDEISAELDDSTISYQAHLGFRVEGLGFRLHTPHFHRNVADGCCRLFKCRTN